MRAIDVIKTNSKARVGGGIIVTRDNGHLVNLIVSPTPPRQFLLGFFFNNFIFFMASIWRNIPDSSIECFLNFFDKLRECSDFLPPFDSTSLRSLYHLCGDGSLVLFGSPSIIRGLGSSSSLSLSPMLGRIDSITCTIGITIAFSMIYKEVIRHNWYMA